MVVVVPLFLLSDFKRMAHYIEKRMRRHAINKVRPRPPPCAPAEA